MKEKLSEEARNNLNKVKHSSAVHINKVDIHPQNTEEHEITKAEICYEIRSQGFNFVTEAEFKQEHGGIRPDIYVLETDECIEIETDTYKLDERKQDYDNVDQMTVIPLNE